MADIEDAAYEEATKKLIKEQPNVLYDDILIREMIQARHHLKVIALAKTQHKKGKVK